MSSIVSRRGVGKNVLQKFVLNSNLLTVKRALYNLVLVFSEYVNAKPSFVDFD